jgi:APA family basic amino acid/polyamine antiporter
VADLDIIETRPLRRRLGLLLLLLYGLGTIIGAGIYVVIGAVAEAAGPAMPLAFLASAGLAAITGLAYVELSVRHPEAAGEVSYVSQAFHSGWLSRLVGLALIFVAIVAGASIARGTAGYVNEYFQVAAWIPGALIVFLFTAVACLGVRESVGIAAALSLVEIGGLVFVFVLGADALGALPEKAGSLIPGDGAGWLGVLSGAFIAFFAFLGFEALVNMAEETPNPERTLPRVLVLSVVISAAIYGLVALVAVLAVGATALAGAKGGAPLCLLVERAGLDCRWTLGPVGLVALANGVIIDIILIARLAYGMAKRGLIPPVFSTVSRSTGTPWVATLCGGGIMFALTVSLSLDSLVKATSGITLAVFALVNLSLWRLQRIDPRPDLPVRLPRWLPVFGAAVCVGMLALAIAEEAGAF